jgi:protein involved in plasmid replication-relaxation
LNDLHDLPFPPVEEPLESEPETLPANGYVAVHRGDRVLLLRDQHPLPKKHAEDLTPQARDLEILRALWRYRFLLTSQIADEWWPGCSLYAAQRRLLRMTAAGWVTRFRPRLSKGKHEWIYQLDRKGFELAKTSWGLEGRYIEEGAKWRPRHVREYSVVEHDLQVNAWVRAYRKLVGDQIIDWLGPDQGRIEVPTLYDSHARRYRKVGIDDTPRGWENYRRPRDFRLRDFAPLVPDATITIYSDSLGKELDLLIELDRTRRATKNVDKLRRYDAFLTAWCRLTDRYRRGAVLAMAVFICPSEQQAKSLMEVADREVTGRIAGGGGRPEEWPYPGREQMLFCAEEDVHDGFGLAWSLPRHAAGERDTDYFWAVDTELPLGR